MSVRIAIAEDQRMVRELLAALLVKQSGFRIVSEAGTGREAVRLAQSEHPDVLILDVGLPDLDGFEVARAVRTGSPETKIVALSVHSEERFVQHMLKAGADGYVVKSAALDELVQAINAVTQGKMYLSPGIARQALRGAPGGRSRLGHRERQVLAMIAEGRRSAEIAARLGISAGTVEVHRRNIMQKLDLHSIAELTKYAVREGLTSI